MSTEKNGGSAFPHGNNQWGMTLRDYFAAAVMQGMGANPSFAAEIKGWARCQPGDPRITGAEYAAKHAYEIADAMLKARES